MENGCIGRICASRPWPVEIVSDRTLSNDRRDTAAGSRDRQTHTTEAPFDEEETTNQVASEVGADGAGLSCPGSSVVADGDER